MGNSLGSVVAISAAVGDFASDKSALYLSRPERTVGLCLFNCGVGMNSRNIVNNPKFSPLQRTLLNALFDGFNALIFDNKALLRYILNTVVTRDLLRDALTALYVHDPTRVDDALVESFYAPVKDGGEGAVEALRQIYTNDAGRTPMELHDRYAERLDGMPIHLVWGDRDVVTPLAGDVGEFYCDRVANNRGKRETSIEIVGAGHIPFDDNPEVSNGSMLRWMDKVVASRSK